MEIQTELLAMLKQYFVEERFDVRAYADASSIANHSLVNLINLGRFIKATESLEGEAIWVRAITPVEHAGVLVFTEGDLTVTILDLHKDGEMRRIDFHHPESVNKLHALVNFYCNQQLAEA